jgi:hypothetical protein
MFKKSKLIKGKAFSVNKDLNSKFIFKKDLIECF